MRPKRGVFFRNLGKWKGKNLRNFETNKCRRQELHTKKSLVHGNKKNEERI